MANHIQTRGAQAGSLAVAAMDDPSCLRKVWSKPSSAVTDWMPAVDPNQFRRRGLRLTCQIPTPYSSGRSTAAPILSSPPRPHRRKRAMPPEELFRFLGRGVKSVQDAARAYEQLQKLSSGKPLAQGRRKRD